MASLWLPAMLRGQGHTRAIPARFSSPRTRSQRGVALLSPRVARSSCSACPSPRRWVLLRVLRPMPQQFAVTLDEGITLELGEPRAGFVGSGLPHGDHSLRVSVPEMVDEPRVVTEVLFQELPGAIACVRRIIAHRAPPVALNWCPQSPSGWSAPRTKTPSGMAFVRPSIPGKANGKPTATLVWRHPRLGGLRWNIPAAAGRPFLLGLSMHGNCQRVRV